VATAKLAKRQRKVAGISDAAVQAKTGKTWPEWLALLDRAGARKMNHQEIASYLHDELGCSGWWSQMVTVGYEQARGMRDPRCQRRGCHDSRKGPRQVPGIRQPSQAERAA
jgi:hypothetical protein